jgi:hypothetical protein
MKFLLALATLGLATFVVLKRRNPDLAERVQSAVTDAAKDAADTVKDNPFESAGDVASGLRDKAKGLVK